MNIWEGVYNNFKEVPVSGKGFDDERWINSLLKKIPDCLSVKKEEAAEILSTDGTLLPFLATVLNAALNRINVLDLGGGLGIDYLKTIRTMTAKKKINYYIIEKERVCKMGEKIFKNDRRIKFYTFFPRNLEVDIVHINSSLQYLENWEDYLYKMSDYKPSYFLFTDLSAGNIPTYATVQNYYGSKIPYWFFNINEIKRLMKKMKFRLLFKSVYERNFFGKKQGSLQRNFPLKYQLGNACNLLFHKSNV